MCMPRSTVEINFQENMRIFHTILKSDSKIALLYALSQHEPHEQITTKQLSEETELHQFGIKKHLDYLEKHGYIHVNIPSSESRQGLVLKYSLNNPKMAQEILNLAQTFNIALPGQEHQPYWKTPYSKQQPPNTPTEKLEIQIPTHLLNKAFNRANKLGITLNQHITNYITNSEQ